MALAPFIRIGSQRVLIPVAEAAQIVGLSVWTLRRWAYNGTIASSKMGSRLLVPVSEIEALVSASIRPRRVKSEGGGQP